MDLGVLGDGSQTRQCPECGEVFETDAEGNALAKFADHYLGHQPSAAQWTVAYRKMQGLKPKKELAGPAAGF